MGSYYWIKLYHEMLDDPKVYRLGDRLAWRMVQIFLLAGRIDEDGQLPSTQDIAFALRMDAEQLETDLIELQNVGILSSMDGRWLVTKFKDRQRARTSAERVKMHRDGKQDTEYYGGNSRHGYDTVTDRYTDKNRLDKITDKEKDTEKITPEAGGGGFSGFTEDFGGQIEAEMDY